MIFKNFSNCLQFLKILCHFYKILQKLLKIEEFRKKKERVLTLANFLNF